MEHHGHHHSSHNGRNARGSLKRALIITGVFLVAEFAGALYTNSLALLADSGHMVTDVAALSLSLAATWFSTRRTTPQKTFGFYRVEILAALLNGVFLILISLYIFYQAWGRLGNPPEVKAGWMLIVALVGLSANIASAYLLFGSRAESLNIRGAFFHVLSDAVGSLGAVIASLAILFGGYEIADPIISAIVGVMILCSSWILIRDAVDILLEGTPSHVNIVTLQEQLREIPGVGSVHDLHVWTLTSGVLAMSCHAVMSADNFSQSSILAKVKALAREEFKIDHTTIQIEEPNATEQVMDSCDCNLGAWHSAR
jgi:cobalt-zinc-cadmium efflux system protein